MTYPEIIKFENGLLSLGFVGNPHVSEYELVFDSPVNRWFLIRVYSGIPRFQVPANQSIRVRSVYISTDTFLTGIEVPDPLLLKHYIAMMKKDVKRFRFCDCGGILVVKRSVRGKFLGCTRYPRCSHREELPII